MYISKDPISILGGFALYAYVKDVNRFVDVFGLKEFNQAMKEALEWLEKRGFRASKPNIGKLGDTKGKPIGMMGLNSEGKIVGFRVEYDERSKAHINVFSGKEKGPHFEFDASEKTVKKIQKKYSGCT